MILKSTVHSKSSSFIKNREEMLALVDGFRQFEAQVKATSNSKKAKFDKRGKLLPRQRLALLLDRGKPFIQLSSLAGFGMHQDDGKNGFMAVEPLLELDGLAENKSWYMHMTRPLKEARFLPLV